VERPGSSKDPLSRIRGTRERSPSLPSQPETSKNVGPITTPAFEHDFPTLFDVLSTMEEATKINPPPLESLKDDGKIKILTVGEPLSSYTSKLETKNFIGE
jgi:hypothetical protein